MSGKFIHRNRECRKQILLCLEGEQTWLFVSPKGGLADKHLNMATSATWCGYRSSKLPSMLTVSEMHALAASERELGVSAQIVTFKAGDAMTFDGRWWHATSYNSPVFLMFFTPGRDMIEAVSEHKERHGKESHKHFKVCSVSMAKTAKLASTWKHDETGKPIKWEDTEGYAVLS